MSGAFSRGAHTMNSMFKPMVRKGYHKKSSSAAGDTVSGRETPAAAKVESDQSKLGSDGGGGYCSWVPDEKTGIYYPKGQEKVMQEIPAGAGRDVDVHWYSHNYQENCL
ncbi:unnamed protein product [Linum tenue]|uniref:Uncharacterized protein n=1 Tax=Linum tenue TaxID=586396 RepID=A0AAV0LP93_9ROSI|nr:unnamed protein product [Linum tenue]